MHEGWGSHEVIHMRGGAHMRLDKVIHMRGRAHMRLDNVICMRGGAHMIQH